MKILIPVDGSVHSEAALAAIANHVWNEPLSIKLLNVFKQPDSLNPFQKKSRLAAPELEQHMDNTRQALNELAASISERIPDCTSTSEVLVGDPKVSILKVASQWKAELIVVGSTGKKGVDRLILGSVSEAVLDQAECPVLIVKEGPMSAHIREGRDFSRILIAFDGSSSSKGAVSWLSALSWPEESVFKLLTSIPEPERSIENVADTQRAAWMLRQWGTTREKNLKVLSKEAEKLGRGVDNEYVSLEVVPGEPKDRIVDIARGWRCELVVMGSYGKTGINKLVAGSLSKAVAAKSPCSILIVKGVDIKGKLVSDKKKLEKMNLASKVSLSMPPPQPRRQSDQGDTPPFKMF